MKQTANEHASARFIPDRHDAIRPLISVVVPVYNEEGCLLALYERLTSVLETLNGEYEIVFVDDGSRDRSLEIMRELHARDPRVGYFTFSRNFGHEAATTCGLHEAKGQTVVIIDADLQDPPEVIPEMVERWREGYDIVYAQRRSRAGESWLTKTTSHLFYRCLRSLIEIDVPLDTGDYRLMDQAVVAAFGRLNERNRFVRGMISWTGFRQTAVYYDRDARLAGQTNYNFVKRLRLAFDAICGLSTVPLRYLTYVGGAMTFVTSTLLLLVIAVALLGGSIAQVTPTGAALLFMGSVQLLALGLMGEYLGRIHTEVQRRPLYLVRESQPAEIVTHSSCEERAAV